MFWKKKKEKAIVSCKVCKCLIYEKDAKEVINSYFLNDRTQGLYCHKCKPEYDLIDVFGERCRKVEEHYEPIEEPKKTKKN